MTASRPGTLGDALVTDFRTVMSMFPTGVTVVATTGPHGEPRGMTCSAMCSVTLDPPTLLVCLRNGGPTLTALLSTEEFSVNLLHAGARETAELFASGDPNRFDRVRWLVPDGHRGPHLPDDAHSIANCRVRHHQRVGDHTVVFGEVERVYHRPGHLPLLYGLRRYATWPVAS